MIVRPAAGDYTPAARSIDPLRSLSAHRKLSLALAAASVIGAIAASQLLGRPQWSSEALVHVNPHQTKVLEDDKELDLESNTQYRQFVQQQAAAMTEYEVITEALRGLGPKTPFWNGNASGLQAAAESLSDRLIVRAPSDTYLIKISLTSDSPAGLAETVNAVVRSYLESQSLNQLHGRDTRILELKRHRDELASRIKEDTAYLDDLAVRMGVEIFSERFAEDHAVRMNTLKRPLKDRRVQLQTQMTGLMPEHPAYKAAAAAISEIDREIARYSADPRAEDEVQRRRREITRAQERLRKIDDRLDFLEVEARGVGRVWLSSEARTPTEPVKSKRLKVFLAVLVLGLGLSASAGMLIDLGDDRLHAPEDLEALAGFPCLAWIPERGVDWPDSVFKDQLRQAALSIARDRRSHNTRVIALTGVRAGAGSSSLALWLAAELRALGLESLAVEANGFAPDDRFSAAMSARLPSISQEGGYAKTETELAKMRERFDLVVVDLPPVLMSPEASAWCALADSVIIVAEAGGTRGKQMREALERLRRARPAAVGVMINRVKAERAPRQFLHAFEEHFSLRTSYWARLAARWGIK